MALGLVSVKVGTPWTKGEFSRGTVYDLLGGELSLCPPEGDSSVGSVSCPPLPRPELSDVDRAVLEDSIWDRRRARDGLGSVPPLPRAERAVRERASARAEELPPPPDWLAEISTPAVTEDATGKGDAEMELRQRIEALEAQRAEDAWRMAQMRAEIDGLADTRRHVGRLTGEMDGMRSELEQLREICEANGLVVPRGGPGRWTFGDLERLGGEA